MFRGALLPRSRSSSVCTTRTLLLGSTVMQVAERTLCATVLLYWRTVKVRWPV